MWWCKPCELLAKNRKWSGPFTRACRLPLPSPHISALATSTYYPAHGLFMPSLTFTRTTVLSALFLVFELLLGYVRASKNSELETPLKTSDIGEINI